MELWKKITASERLFLVFLCLLSVFYYHHFMLNRASVTLEIEVEQKTLFKLYWSDGRQPFSEKRRAVVRLQPEQRNYRFQLADLAEISRLRVDPMEYIGEARIFDLTIAQHGFETFVIDLAALVAENGVAQSFVEDGVLALTSESVDPFYRYLPAITKQHTGWLLSTGVSLFLVIFVLLSCAACRPFWTDFRYVPVVMTAILALIIVMFGNSKPNAHPDEYVHLQAVEYYQQHWLPPDVESDEIRSTYSVYGHSRLNNGEVYYLFAGKFSKIFQSMNIDRVQAVRSFNVFLFILIIFYARYSIPARLVSLPLIISPQLWYVFSYCGSDAFSIFLCFVAAVQISDLRSLLNRLLDRPVGVKAGVAVVSIGIMVGLMLLMKKNYYPMIGLFYFALFFRMYKQGLCQSRMVLIYVLLISVIGLSIAAGRVGVDYLVNGAERADKIAAMQEKTAHRWFKPSNELHQNHISLYKKARGTTLQEVAFGEKWFAKTFNSAFGVYGYSTISAPEQFYDLVRYLSIFAVAYLVLMLTVRGNHEERIYLSLVVILSVALIGASLHHSWTKDFQPQGRYLFPILPLIGVLLARNQAIFQCKTFHLLIAHFLALAFYSFIFVGLAAIPQG